MATREQAEQRFWSRVDLEGPVPVHRPELGPCHLWTGACNPKGYGRFDHRSERIYLAHRFALWLAGVRVPVGFEPDHLCRRRACVRVSHIEVVTHGENVRRGNGNGNLDKTHCPRGHPYDGTNRRGARTCSLCVRVAGRRSDRRETGADPDAPLLSARECGQKGMHDRWHARRGVVKPGCPFCVIVGDYDDPPPGS